MNFLSLLVPTFEIGLIAIFIHYLLSFFWNTRAMDLLASILAFLILFAGARALHLPVIEALMLYVMNVSVLALLILFQPELRLALSKFSLRGKNSQKLSEFEPFLEGLMHSIYRFSDRRVGALILLENQDSLEEYAKSGVPLSANFSSELIESIFASSSPLHDGAVIIRGTQVVCAGAILPLAEDTNHITRGMGTRHRATLRISELSDALCIAVSEEDGRVSIARQGIMTRGIKSDRFLGVIRSVFTAPEVENSSWRRWFS